MIIDGGARQEDNRAGRLAVHAPWTRALETVWAVVALEEFCRASGIDPIQTFVDPLRQCQKPTNPYAHHTWRVMPHSAAPAGVLHAFPRGPATAAPLWEEWFLGANGVRHHVLTPVVDEEDEQVFNGDPDDPEHPPEVLGRPWRYWVDDDLRPVLLQ